MAKDDEDLIPVGQSTRHEYMIRWRWRNGRIVDDGPYEDPPPMPVPGAKKAAKIISIEYLHRTIQVDSSDWAPITPPPVVP